MLPSKKDQKNKMNTWQAQLGTTRSARLFIQFGIVWHSLALKSGPRLQQLCADVLGDDVQVGMGDTVVMDSQVK